MSRQEWNSLDTPGVLYSLLSKLPRNTRGIWDRKVFMLRKQLQLKSELSDLLDFVKEEML